MWVGSLNVCRNASLDIYDHCAGQAKLPLASQQAPRGRDCATALELAAGAREAVVREAAAGRATRAPAESVRDWVVCRAACA